MCYVTAERGRAYRIPILRGDRRKRQAYLSRPTSRISIGKPDDATAYAPIRTAIPPPIAAQEVPAHDIEAQFRHGIGGGRQLSAAA